MTSTRVLQQQRQQQRQFQQWEPQQQWRPQHQWCPQQPWGPGGSDSVGCSSGPASWGARRGGRDVGPCQYRILTGPGAGTTCSRPDHSAQRCYSRLDDLYRLAVARSSTNLLCPAVPSGFLTGLYIPSFSRNLVGVGYLQDRGITFTFPAHERTTIYTDASTGALLASFTREPHSGLFVLHTASHQVAGSGQVTASPLAAESGQVTASPPVAPSSQVVASGQVATSCSCWSLAHPTVLWHHRLGHPSIPCLRSMANHRLVSVLPRVFAWLPPSPAPPCTPCAAGRLRATPHSSSLRPATAPFQTLHLDAWGPTPSQGPERERYFLVVVDD
ncbi:unnamed protein product [Closterium sp. NIES-53]